MTRRSIKASLRFTIFDHDGVATTFGRRQDPLFHIRNGESLSFNGTKAELIARSKKNSDKSDEDHLGSLRKQSFSGWTSTACQYTAVLHDPFPPSLEEVRLKQASSLSRQKISL